MRDREVIEQQVLALRSAAVTVVSQADAILMMLIEPEKVAAAEVADGACAHPDDKRESTATVGNPHSFFCHACKEIIEPKKAEGDS